MAQAMVIYVFMLLFQKDGITGGAGGSLQSCMEAREAAIKEATDMGQEILAASLCEKFTLEPYVK